MLRWGLVLLALVGIRYGIEGLRIPSTADRELAAWQIATAVGLLTAACRPVASEALLPTLASAVGLTAAVSVRDIAQGRTSTPQEAPHLWLVIAFAVTVVLWMVADGRAEAGSEPVRSWRAAGSLGRASESSPGSRSR